MAVLQFFIQFKTLSTRAKPLFYIQVCGIVQVCYLLWRVETLSVLSIPQKLPLLQDRPDARGVILNEGIRLIQIPLGVPVR